MPLPKQGKKIGNCCNAITENRRGKKNLEWNCGNGIAKIGEIFFLSIVAMSLPKMGGKKNLVAEIWGGILKKNVLRSQYFYNIFTTNHKLLVIISSNLNLTLRLLF